MIYLTNIRINIEKFILLSLCINLDKKIMFWAKMKPKIQIGQSDKVHESHARELKIPPNNLFLGDFFLYGNGKELRL